MSEVVLRMRERVCGAIVASAAALPVTPEGLSFLELWWREIVGHGLVPGLLMLVGFGSPFLFGLGVAIAGAERVRPWAVDLVRIPIGCMHGQLLLVSFVIWRSEQGIAGLPLFGFAVVGALGFVLTPRRGPARFELRQSVEWGAAMIFGVAAWCRMQAIVGIDLGIAIDVLLAASLALAVLVRTTTARTTVAPTTS